MKINETFHLSPFLIKIIANNITFHLSPFLMQTDVPKLVNCLKDKEIVNKWSVDENSGIPYPYTEADAIKWLGIHAKYVEKYGEFSYTIIRNDKKELIGEIGFTFNTPFNTRNTAEITYWLAKPFWGLGIMTAAKRAMCSIGFRKFKLNKIIAHVDVDNIGSIRCLEKNGFKEEGYLKEHFCKNYKYYDVKLFGLTYKEWERNLLHS
jgi:[ribosomal protein S5]-alanine N-acetyltransferase